MPSGESGAVLDLSRSHPGLEAFSKYKKGILYEGCIWCMTECEHLSGVHVKVSIDTQTKILTINWKCTDDELEKIRVSHHHDAAVEYGAEAVSMVAIYEFTPYRAIGRSVKTTGIDYRLSTNKNPAILFTNEDARLEISGILRETSNNGIQKRLRQKARQSMQSDDTKLPVYVVVVEFSVPMARMELRHV